MGPTGPTGASGIMGPAGPPGPVGPMGSAYKLRVISAPSQALPAPNADTTDFFELTSLATSAAFAAPAGAPTTGQQLLIGIMDNGVSRQLQWSAAYVAQNIPLPTQTVPGHYLYVCFIWTTANAMNKWLLLATNE